MQVILSAAKDKILPLHLAAQHDQKQLMAPFLVA
jgi:hypothetical protein